MKNVLHPFHFYVPGIRVNVASFPVEDVSIKQDGIFTVIHAAELRGHEQREGAVTVNQTTLLNPITLFMCHLSVQLFHRCISFFCFFVFFCFFYKGIFIDRYTEANTQQGTTKGKGHVAIHSKWSSESCCLRIAMLWMPSSERRVHDNTKEYIYISSFVCTSIQYYMGVKEEIDNEVDITETYHESEPICHADRTCGSGSR